MVSVLYLQVCVSLLMSCLCECSELKMQLLLWRQRSVFFEELGGLSQMVLMLLKFERWGFRLFVFSGFIILVVVCQCGRLRCFIMDQVLCVVVIVYLKCSFQVLCCDLFMSWVRVLCWVCYVVVLMICKRLSGFVCVEGF